MSAGLSPMNLLSSPSASESALIALSSAVNAVFILVIVSPDSIVVPAIGNIVVYVPVLSS